MSLSYGPTAFPGVLPASAAQVKVHDLNRNSAVLTVPVAVDGQGRVSFTVATAGRYIVRISNLDLDSSSYFTVDLSAGNTFVAGRSVNRATMSGTSIAASASGNVSLIALNAITAATTVTLPDATQLISGAEVAVKDETGNANTNTVTVHGFGSQTIDGSATKTITTAYGVLRLYTDGVNFFTI